MVKLIPILLPLVFIGVGLLAGAVMGEQSGWYRLMIRYPDQPETPLLKLRNRSGWMRGLGFNGVLTLSVCPSGLRVHILRLFGPFSKDFFVPWSEIQVRRGVEFFVPAARLEFGSPAVGSLSIRAFLANRLARAAGERWPESGPFPQETPGQILTGVLTLWAVLTVIGALILVLLPRVLAPHGPWPPLAISIGLPAILLGLGALVEYTVRVNALEAERLASPPDPN